ncbi:hypothetical protein HOY82DRAFT_634142 [Tuber indicum]|nr:hypothetical protein HOY82DRAFT_634142 [Tuber indicum]
MPALVLLIGKARPDVKSIYRSHIEVCKDLVECVGNPQVQVWSLISDHIKEVDILISHRMDKYFFHSVPFNIIGFMPACTDWLDGLNKNLGECDLKFCHRNLDILCNEKKMNYLLYPAREYLTQIERSDRKKAIPEVIESYRKLCDRIISDAPERLPPQLLICRNNFSGNYIITQRVAICRDCKRYGISEDWAEWSDVERNANHRRMYCNCPCIEHGKSGFLVELGDTDSVADHLFDLYTYNDLYTMMSKYAKAIVSDEVELLVMLPVSVNLLLSSRVAKISSLGLNGPPTWR